MAETILGLGPGVTWIAKWAIDKSKITWLHKVRPYLDHLYNDKGSLRQSYELEDKSVWILTQDLLQILDKKSNLRSV